MIFKGWRMNKRTAPKIRRRIVTSVVTRTFTFATLIFGFLYQPQGAWSSPIIIIGFVFVGLYGISVIVAEYRGVIHSTLGIYVNLIYFLMTFVFVFSVIYWNFGSNENFNIRLTRLDSVYFTVGTLSTAGTGNLVAISELARTVQLVQMVLDLGFLLLAVTLVVTRLSTFRIRSK